MRDGAIVPCLWFDDQAQGAAEFYAHALPNDRVTAVARYPETSDNPAGKSRGSVLTVEFEVAGQRFTALNGGPVFVINLMFSGAQHGRAEEAVRAYVGIFPDARVAGLERYTAFEGPTGTITHGRFVIAGQEMVAMDSHVAHGVEFNEGVSVQVMCQDQAEVDRYCAALSEGGQQGPCGWLRDRFGLSW